jgi:sugar phosphate isomerase/epimerase
MPIAQTLTGNFPIGYRWIGSEWQKNFDRVLDWTAENSFATIDLPVSHLGEAAKLAKRGLRIASVDLAAWGGYQALITPDKAKRAAAVEQATRTIRQGADAGATLFFTLMLPDQPELPRAENFKYMVESYRALAPVLEQARAKLVIEGWPGPGALCCTPETYRAIFREIPSPALGINFDPSHLLRMGIEPTRFLAEFHRCVFHVHGKDTELNGENLYEFGHTQPATFAPAAAFGEWAWRYTIPGHGQARWTAIFELLAQADYSGMVSIELEDARFNGSEEGEKLGLVKSREYLEGC